MCSVKYATLSEKFHRNMAERIIHKEERLATQLLFGWAK
jgi:hypothetical protein